MTHKQKVRLAKSMMNSQERRMQVSPWDSIAWATRRAAHVGVRSPIQMRRYPRPKPPKKGFFSRFLGKDVVTNHIDEHERMVTTTSTVDFSKTK